MSRNSRKKKRNIACERTQNNENGWNCEHLWNDVLCFFYSFAQTTYCKSFKRTILFRDIFFLQTNVVYKTNCAFYISFFSTTNFWILCLLFVAWQTLLIRMKNSFSVFNQLEYFHYDENKALVICPNCEAYIYMALCSPVALKKNMHNALKASPELNMFFFCLSQRIKQKLEQK